MIVAVKEESRIYIGSDSITLFNKNIIQRGKCKSWSYFSNPNVVVAAEGDTNIIEHLRQGAPFNHTTPDRENVFDWLKTTLPLSEGFFEVLICGNSKIFFARSDFFITEAPLFHAIGPGSEMAMGIIEALRPYISSGIALAKKAIETTSAYRTEVGGEIHIQMV